MFRVKQQRFKLEQQESELVTDLDRSRFDLELTYPGRSFRPSETAAYTAGNDYKTAKILP